jgi:hypothetical protein
MGAMGNAGVQTLGMVTPMDYVLEKARESGPPGTDVMPLSQYVRVPDSTINSQQNGLRQSSCLHQYPYALRFPSSGSLRCDLLSFTSVAHEFITSIHQLRPRP